MTLRLKSVALPTGPRLEYAECGNEFGIPVLFLHGYSDSWRSFEPLLAHLPPSLRAIALSQRGHGDSDRPEADYRYQHFAGDVLAFLDAMNIERAIIVGHCMGSHIALHFASEHPNRVRGLVLIGAYDTMKSNAPVLDLWASVSQLEDPVDPAFVREFQASTIASPVADGLLDTMVKESLKVPARIWREACAGLLDDDVRLRIPEISAPTLILWGDADTICGRREQNALIAALQYSRLRVYPNVGHALHWERPKQAAHDVASFAQDALPLPARVGAAQRGRWDACRPVSSRVPRLSKMV